MVKLTKLFRQVVGGSVSPQINYGDQGPSRRFEEVAKRPKDSPPDINGNRMYFEDGSINPDYIIPPEATYPFVDVPTSRITHSPGDIARQEKEAQLRFVPAAANIDEFSTEENPIFYEGYEGPTLLKQESPSMLKKEGDPKKPDGSFNGEFVASAADRINRQKFMESGGEKDPNAAVSPAGAIGTWQIMPGTQKDLEDRGLIPKGLDPRNPEHNRQMRDAKINALMNLQWIKNPPQPIGEENKLARIYASYNWGEGNVLKALNRAKKEGVDIYGDPRNWIEYLPKETRDYVMYILYGVDK